MHVHRRRLLLLLGLREPADQLAALRELRVYKANTEAFRIISRLQAKRLLRGSTGRAHRGGDLLALVRVRSSRLSVFASRRVLLSLVLLLYRVLFLLFWLVLS